jgi:hypothetical protein
MDILKGLLIDPENQTITEVDVYPDRDGESHLSSMYSHLNCRQVYLARDILTFLPSGPADDVWFDEEGNYSGYLYMFQIPGYVPLIGKGLILGYDNMGRSTSHTLTPVDINLLRSGIRYYKRENN